MHATMFCSNKHDIGVQNDYGTTVLYYSYREIGTFSVEHIDEALHEAPQVRHGSIPPENDCLFKFNIHILPPSHAHIPLYSDAS